MLQCVAVCCSVLQCVAVAVAYCKSEYMCVCWCVLTEVGSLVRLNTFDLSLCELLIPEYGVATIRWLLKIICLFCRI